MGLVPFVLGVLFAGQDPATPRSFVISNTNKTVAITRVWYVMSDGPWREIVPVDPIKPMSSSTFTLGPGKICLIDIKVKFEDYVDQVFTSVDVCKGQTVTAT